MVRFLKYFKVPFIVTAIIAVICIGIRISNGDEEVSIERYNYSDLTGNVFDYAGALGEANVQALDAYVTEIENQISCDIAVIVLNESLEGFYSTSPERWVREYAKDFVLEHDMGYEKAQGESIVFIDNIYREPSTGRVYSYIFTWGDIENRLTTDSCEAIMNDALILEDDASSSEYMRAYKRVIELLPSYIGHTEIGVMARKIKPIYIIGIAFVIAAIYVLVNWSSKLGVRTTNSTTYVENGKPNITRRQDIFLRKSVSKVKIQNSSGGGGGGGHGGGGGGHSR